MNRFRYFFEFGFTFNGKTYFWKMLSIMLIIYKNGVKS